MRRSRPTSYILVPLGILAVGLLCLIMRVYDIEPIRSDRCLASSDLVWYAIAGVSLLVTVWVVWEFPSGQLLVPVPTSAFAVLFFILVFPGVIVTAVDAAHAPVAAYSSVFSIVAFDLGVIVTTVLLRFRQHTVVKAFLSKIGSMSQLDRVQMRPLIIYRSST